MAGEVLFAYNEYGQPTYNWQSHVGAVIVNTTAEGQDTYAKGLAGTSRPAGAIHPKERAFALDYGAGGGMDDALGRVVDHLWYAYAASADRERYTYGYDRASNRLYRENTLTSGHDELYGYDEVNRLIAFQRGELNANKDDITGTAGREEDWSLDMTGNWPGYVQKTSGSTDLDQGRTHNPVNEITGITAATGTDWADPVHDRAGNMTIIPKPASLADGLTATYDAWNRRVEVKHGQTVIARYEYLCSCQLETGEFPRKRFCRGGAMGHGSGRAKERAWRGARSTPAQMSSAYQPKPRRLNPGPPWLATCLTGGYQRSRVGIAR